MAYAEIKGIKIRSGALIDQIAVKVFDGQQVMESEEYGGYGGSESFFDVPMGESIQHVIVYTGDVVDSLQFVTDRGTTSQKFGGDGGSKNVFTVPEGGKLIGIYGRNGSLLDSIGFYYGRMQ